MKPKAILVGHTPGETDDRAAAWLCRTGYDIQWCTPCTGDRLPVSTEEVAVTVVYGGVYDVHEKSQHRFLHDELGWIERCLKNEVPTLGLCLGAQLMADVLGAEVCKHPEGLVEYGYQRLVPAAAAGRLFPEDFMVLEAHWEGWFELPAGATHLASTEHFPQQAFRYANNAYAFQFHPEAHRTMLERWVARRSAVRSSRPGSHPGDRQLSDCEKYDGAMAAWFEGFLAEWIGPADRGELPSVTAAAG